MVGRFNIVFFVVDGIECFLVQDVPLLVNQRNVYQMPFAPVYADNLYIRIVFKIAQYILIDIIVTCCFEI